MRARRPGKRPAVGRSATGRSNRLPPPCRAERKSGSRLRPRRSQPPRRLRSSRQPSIPHRAGLGGEADASSPTDAAESATPKTSARALTEEVNELFFAKDYCKVTSGGDESLRQRCHRAGALADQIVNVPKTSAGSWAYGMESEIDRHLTELSQPGAGWGVVERKEVRCNALGCVVYMEGPARCGLQFRQAHLGHQQRPVDRATERAASMAGPWSLGPKGQRSSVAGPAAAVRSAA